eukprot:scaffold366016_cov76-Cyclotella_meneghiniana.AAC.1
MHYRPTATIASLIAFIAPSICCGKRYSFISSSHLQKKHHFNRHVKRATTTGTVVERRSILCMSPQKAPIDADEFNEAISSNNLQSVVNYLESHETVSLSDKQLQSIFDVIETVTQNSDGNTVNTRLLEDAKAVEFRSLDRVRAQMTKLYRILRDSGRLQAFGAVGREPPKALVSSSNNPMSLIYPASGSKIITPTLLGQITGIEMINLTPQPTNFLLYGGVALAVLEGLLSLYFHVNFNLIVGITLLLAVSDQVLVSGAVFETGLRMVLPEMTKRITKHEAGHFLCSYLLGCPVEGVVLSTWAALQDGRFGGRSTRAVSAGTSYYDIDLSEQISGIKPLTRESIDRFSVIVMAGIAAEALEFGRADGGAGDEEALVRFLRSLNPRSGNAVSAWSPNLIRNQARWGATQAVLLLKEYKPCYDALVDALERGGDLGTCIVAIEQAAKEEGLGWLRKPLGTIFEEGDYGRWALGSDITDTGMNSNSDVMESTIGRTNGVPNYGEEPTTSTEEFLQMYREKLTKKLEVIDEQLAELDKEFN